MDTAPLHLGELPDQTGRVVVITGASSGLGRIAAQRLAERGATVIMAVRDVAKGGHVRSALIGDHGRSASTGDRVRSAPAPDRVRSAPALDLRVRELDLADLDSVRRFADRMHADGQRIDVLLNNAGLGLQEPRLSPQGYELTFATNHLGHFALTGLLLDLFRPGHDPRVVTVASRLYRVIRTGLDLGDPAVPVGSAADARAVLAGLAAEGSFGPGIAYVRSKIANLLFGAELDRRLRAAGSPVRSLLVHPGSAATPMNQSARGVLQRTMQVVFGALIGRSAERGTVPLLFAAADPAARSGVFLGPSLRKWDSRVHFAPFDPPVDDRALAARLWTVSEAATGVAFLPAGNGSAAGRPVADAGAPGVRPSALQARETPG